MILSIETKALRAAALCVANKKDLRIYLHGVCVSVNSDNVAMVYGTNGHILFAGQSAIDCKGSEHKPGYDIIIPADVVKKINKKADYVDLWMMADGTYMLGDIRFTPLEGRFPDVSRVVPDRAAFANPGICYVNPDYLVSANEALSIYYQAGPGKCFPLLTQSSGQCVVHNGRNDAVVVVMSMRMDNLDYQGLNKDFMQVQQLAA